MRMCGYFRVGFLCAVLGLFSISSGQPKENQVNKELDQIREQLFVASYTMDSLGILNSMEKFEKLSKDNRNSEMAEYYLAFGDWQIAGRQWVVAPKQYPEARSFLERADARLTKLINSNDQFIEAYVLAISCRFTLAYIQRDRFREIFAGITSLKNKALELAPHNPRLVAMDAAITTVTPEQSGGGLQKGIDRYKEAIAIFKKEPKTERAFPGWGLEIAYAWLGAAYYNQKTPDLQKAKEAFQLSLKERPDFGYPEMMIKTIDAKLNSK